MKMKHLILLLLLALITMVGCLSPDMKGIDPIVDETTPSGKVERGLVSLPDPFGVIDRSGEARNIDLLIPGATQSIEWKVDEHFCFVNIYLYNESKLYRTIAENIDNVGKYDWESEETLDMAHDYEVVVSQHNGTPDENPYLTGDISSKFSMYPSAVRNAQTIVDTLHKDEDQQQKEGLLLSYFTAFTKSGINFIEERQGKQRVDYGIIEILKRIIDWYVDISTDENGNFNVAKFLKLLKYCDIYNSEILDYILSILQNAGFNMENTGGSIILTRDEEVITITNNPSGVPGFPNITINYQYINNINGVPQTLTIVFSVSETEINGITIIQVWKDVFQNGNHLFNESHGETYIVYDGLLIPVGYIWIGGENGGEWWSFDGSAPHIPHPVGDNDYYGCWIDESFFYGGIYINIFIHFGNFFQEIILYDEYFNPFIEP